MQSCDVFSVCVPTVWRETTCLKRKRNSFCQRNGCNSTNAHDTQTCNWATCACPHYSSCALLLSARLEILPFRHVMHCWWNHFFFFFVFWNCVSCCIACRDFTWMTVGEIRKWKQRRTMKATSLQTFVDVSVWTYTIVTLFYLLTVTPQAVFHIPAEWKWNKDSMIRCTVYSTF